jgi:hypothetical protein
VARVLGIRLLKLDARVMLLPADVATSASTASDSRRPAATAIGHGLANAVRCINEGAAILAEARRDGSASGVDET